jgi:hypothetical protein
MSALLPHLPRARHLLSAEQRRALKILAPLGAMAAPGRHCSVMDFALVCSLI